MRKPLPEPVRIIAILQVINHPGQIRPVGSKIAALPWRACLTDQQAVEHQLRDIFSQ